MASPDLLTQLQKTLGDAYQVDREFARGGMSRVFVAHDRVLGREVVVKVLSPEIAGSVSIERFQREIQLAARLQHPHIVPVISAGESGQLPYLMMPLVAGESLRVRLQRTGELPTDEAIRILRDVATALEYAHANGIVHRDIKPENILLSGGSAVVTDFGVAKALSAATEPSGGSSQLTGTGVALGTPTYMAPEQAAADPGVDARADIYAWGIVAYEMLTGAPPFAGRTMTAMIAAHIAEPVPAIHRPGIPQRLAELVMKSLRKRPADRPQSAQEVVAELDSIMSAGGGGESEQRAARLLGGRKYWALGLAAAVLLAAGLAYGRLYGRGGAAPAMKRIAVMPFVNASGSADDDYFADGMSEELGASLGRVRGIQVASHSSVFSFKGREVDPREVGRQLSVDAVLEGRVRRAGQRLRVTAQLTDVNNGFSIWSDSYERDAKDVFAVQDEISSAIASALALKFSEKTVATPSSETQGTADPQAYDLYLRARYYWHQRGADNLRTAISFFERAISRDANFARAYAGLASASALLTEYSYNAAADADARAETAAIHALAIDSSVAEAYLARGLVAVHQWRWSDAGAAYRKALVLDPGNATAHQWYGELLYTRGEGDSSLAEMRRARALDPLAPIPAVALSYALYLNRKYQESVREGERAAELAPALAIVRRMLAESYLQTGDTARALESARLAVNFDSERSNSRGILAHVEARTGHRADAIAMVKRIVSDGKGADASGADLLGYVGLGDTAAALSAVERLVPARSPIVTSWSFPLDPIFDPLRASPRWKAALLRTGLSLRPGSGEGVRPGA